MQHCRITAMASQDIMPALPVSESFAKKPSNGASVVVVVLDVEDVLVVVEEVVVEVTVDEPVVLELQLVVDEVVDNVSVLVTLLVEVLVNVMVSVFVDVTVCLHEAVTVVERDTNAEVAVVVVVGGENGRLGPFLHHHRAFPELTLVVPAPLLFRMCSILPWPSRKTDSGDSSEFSSQGGTAMPR